MDGPLGRPPVNYKKYKRVPDGSGVGRRCKYLEISGGQVADLRYGAIRGIDQYNTDHRATDQGRRKAFELLFGVLVLFLFVVVLLLAAFGVDARSAGFGYARKAINAYQCYPANKDEQQQKAYQPDHFQVRNGRTANVINAAHIRSP